MMVLAKNTENESHLLGSFVVDKLCGLVDDHVPCLRIAVLLLLISDLFIYF